MRNRTVIVTGASGALGNAVVSELLAGGALVHAVSSKPSDFPPGVMPHVADLSDPSQVGAIYAKLEGLWASIHLAGAFASSPIQNTSEAELRRMFEVNAVTCFLCCREAVKRMRQSGSRAGRIVNVAARPALAPVGGMIAYTMSKAAVASLTQCLADEVRHEGILVNAVVPSLLDTPANRAAMPGADFASWPRTEQVARAVVFLAGPDNTLTSGALLPVYGRV